MRGDQERCHFDILDKCETDRGVWVLLETDSGEARVCLPKKKIQIFTHHNGVEKVSVPYWLAKRTGLV